VIVAVMVVCAGVGTAVADITSGLVLYYDFENGANLAENEVGADGTITEGSLSQVAGPTGLGNAADFGTDDDDNRITCGNLYVVGTNAYTLAVWVNDLDESTQQSIITGGDTTENVRLRVVNGETVNMFVYDAQSATDVINDSNTNSTSLTGWYHCVVTYAGGTAGAYGIYVNGVKDNLNGTHANGNHDINTSTWWIGANMSPWFPGVHGQAYGGSLDEVRVYSRELSAADVTELYNFTSGGSTPTPGTLIYGK
jgi:hypothetical protein